MMHMITGRSVKKVSGVNKKLTIQIETETEMKQAQNDKTSVVLSKSQPLNKDNVSQTSRMPAMLLNSRHDKLKRKK